MLNIATLMNKTISEIKRDGLTLTFFDQDANPIFTVEENIHRGFDALYDPEGNFFDLDLGD